MHKATKSQGERQPGEATASSPMEKQAESKPQKRGGKKKLSTSRRSSAGPPTILEGITYNLQARKFCLCRARESRVIIFYPTPRPQLGFANHAKHAAPNKMIEENTTASINCPFMHVAFSHCNKIRSASIIITQDDAIFMLGGAVYTWCRSAPAVGPALQAKLGNSELPFFFCLRLIFFR